MGRWSNAGIHASAKYVRRRSDGAPGANVAKWLPHGCYPYSATFLATSTAVRLPQQKSMLHNPSALFCVSMTLFWRVGRGVWAVRIYWGLGDRIGKRPWPAALLGRGHLGC